MKLTSISDYRDSSAFRLRFYGCFFFLVVIGFIVFNIRFGYNCFRGPFKLPDGELRKIKNPGNTWKYYLTVSGIKPAILTPYGLKYITKDETGKITSQYYDDHYLLLPTADGMLTIQSHAGKLAQSYTGNLKNIDKETKDGLSLDLENISPGMSRTLLPMMLEENSSFRGALNPLGICLFLFTGFGILTFWRAASIKKQAANGVLDNSLSRYGDPKELTFRIDQLLKTLGPNDTDAGTVSIVDKWVLFPQDYDLGVLHLSDLVWIYQTTTKNRLGSEYPALVICTKDKRKILIQDKTAGSVETALSALSSAAPWIIVGYSGKLDIAWQSRPDDLIKEVEQKMGEHK